jgi:hypothetical protein
MVIYQDEKVLAICQVHTVGFIPHTYNKNKARSTDRLKHAKKDSEAKERSKIFNHTVESDTNSPKNHCISMSFISNLGFIGLKFSYR